MLFQTPIYLLMAVRAALPVLRRRRLKDANAKRITFQLEALSKLDERPVSRSSIHVRLDSVGQLVGSPSYEAPAFDRPKWSDVEHDGAIAA